MQADPDEVPTDHDGTAALLLVTALIVNLETRGGEVLKPLEEMVAEMFSRPLDVGRKPALRVALDVLGGIRERLSR